MRTFKLTAVVLIAALAVLMPGSLLAGEKKQSGKLLYRASCKPCHGPNSEHGQYEPLTLIQLQWERFFDKKFVATHAEIKAPDQADKKLLEALDEEDIQKIRKFAIDHAADSENPMTCG